MAKANEFQVGVRSEVVRRTHTTSTLNRSRPAWIGETVVGVSPITGGPVLSGMHKPGAGPGEKRK